ncbi:hypothetical protein HYW17_01680 [Candidatus Uhrbacteria bacterium]|nr:hypothetical protein [Candidatus Uhrbacteria bacterium]
MRFFYERVQVAPCPAFPNSFVSLRPIILITLEHQGTERRYKALIDSGADFCIFHSLVGELLGLEVEQGKEAEFRGVGGGGMHAYFHTITATVGEYSYQLYCGFSRDIPADGYGILGQVGFFDQFKVTLNHQQEEIEVTLKQ